MRLAAIGTILMIAAPALPSDIPAEGLARLAMTPATVKPGGAAHFYRGGETGGCPALTARCRLPAYVRPGDAVLIGQARGAFVMASFTNGERMTEGWLLRAAVIVAPRAAPPRAAWLGTWSRDDEASIAIKTNRKPGLLSISGDAMYGSHDPDRVARGSVNTGSIGDDAAPAGDRLQFGGKAGYECRVQMRLIGAYLAVADNYGCGGMNVTFSGIYRRTARR